jgi:ABC-type transport system substrate-binding protein
VLVVGQIAEPQALDPHAVTAVNDFRILMNVYDGLVRYASGTLEVEPALATDWTISDDGTVYTFTLREGVTFHDGSPFDAEAVVQLRTDAERGSPLPRHRPLPAVVLLLVDRRKRRGDGRRWR